MKALTCSLVLSLLVACTYASLLDFIRLDRKRRQYPDSCCSPPTIMTCCPDHMMAAQPAASCCAPPAITTCCGNVAAPMASSLNVMDEESRDMFNAWNAPVSLGVFINPEATPDDTSTKAGVKRGITPFHPAEGSGSGSGGSFFTSDTAKRDEVPKPVDIPKPLMETNEKQENVKKSTIADVKNSTADSDSSLTVENNEQKSELSAKASEIEEVQGEIKNDKRQTTITCQGQKDWLQCPTYQLIKIKDAFWGRDDEKTCGRSHTERSLQTSKMCAQDESNTMAKLQNACDGESACELVASPVYFDRTDCPDVYKFLRVNWECAHSESRIKAK